jgi:hypothetical protein
MPLFQRILRDSFESLAPEVREFHSLEHRATWRGRTTIVRGSHPLADRVATMSGFPAAGKDVDTTVEFVADAGGETWHRDFGGHRMTSKLWERKGRLCEQFGSLAFTFDLTVRDGDLHWDSCGVLLFGKLPLPSIAFAKAHCCERERAGRYEFTVEATLPRFGRLFLYEGWVVRERATTTTVRVPTEGRAMSEDPSRQSP